MKVSELIGAELDYWAAKANGEKPYIRRERITMDNEHGDLTEVVVDEDRCFQKRWNEEDKPESECKGWFWLGYSRNWELSGPIIERERGRLEPGIQTDGELVWFAAMCKGERRTTSKGPTPLIAAMRAFVASKFGDEVDATRTN